MFSFEFMQNAYLAGTLIAIVSGMMGVFVVARNMPFMTHTLSEIGFAGAAFGIFIGWTPLNGMLAFTTVSSIMVGELSGAVESRRESVISAISGLFIGLGILFLSLSRKNASYATNILFGSVIGISRQDVIQMAALSILVLVVLLLIFRNLKDDSFDAIGSQTNHIHRNLISIIFLIMLAFSVSVAAQIVGSLLIFVLLTLPASSAKYFAHTVLRMMSLAILFALFGVWVGLYLGYLTNWPVTFFIASIEAIIYGISLFYNFIRSKSE
ncbi:metal ABC transporter permease [Lentilactobacillus kisonensis]|uniref:Cation ABC superfamily ATP binding cassette transporter, membrane protein n=1 Tax=Lentilactobacillus kisonensis DSM 19906 = JCM 15041 TaxID=1423766 RepID=A0A0R1NVB5_9LACO|nr:metal ABC transporter permease [Lentilactobacillus kisonensis]KRL20771.1 cation ABC superfamily ATP binding cassette transporter, membrane protein [Lentilactobacillus kisonensis DSM 19906 = JCM 15041]